MKKIISLKLLKGGTLAFIIASLLYISSFFACGPVKHKKDVVLSGLSKRAQFFKVLGHKESSSKYDKENRYGYIGKYQFGEDTLCRLGYYLKDGSKKNDWKGQWTGKYSVYSKKDFLNSYIAQEMAVRELTAANWDVAKGYKLDKVLGQTRHGVYVTKEGILAAMHLKGPSSVVNFVFHGVDSADAMGTSVKCYMNLFADCDKVASI